MLHADCHDVDEFVDQLRPFYPDEIVVGQIGPVVGAHAGLGTIGVAFQETTGRRHLERRSAGAVPSWASAPLV